MTRPGLAAREHLAPPAAEKPRLRCEWLLGTNELGREVFATTCGHELDAWQFDEDPTRYWRFCCYCGHPFSSGPDGRRLMPLTGIHFTAKARPDPETRDHA